MREIRVMFNRKIFSDHEINDEHNKIIRLNLHVYPMLLCYMKQQKNTGEEKISFLHILLHDFRQDLKIIISNFFFFFLLFCFLRPLESLISY